MLKLAVTLAAVLAALAAAPVGGASTQLPVVATGVAAFAALLPWSNVHASKEKGRLGKTVAIGHSTVAIEAAGLDEYQGVDLFDLAHHTALAHAKYIASLHKGWRVASVGSGRFELLSGKKVLQYLVFTAEAASPETFQIHLVKSGSDGQKLMRSLDRAGTRFWLGTQDPRTITSDQDGLALVEQVDQAVGGTQQVTATTALDGTQQGRSELVRADGYVAGFDAAGTLTGWFNGQTIYDYDGDAHCWDVETVDGVESLWSTAFVPTDLYAMRVQPPKSQGATVELDYSGFEANTSHPDTVVLTVDATTHLPVSETVQIDFLGSSITADQAFDWLTPIVEQPQPTGPLCPS